MITVNGLKYATAIFIAAAALALPAMCFSAPKKRAFIISHFHYDPVWTNSQAGETMRAFSIMHQNLEYAKAEPDFKFILSEVDYLKPYWDAYPGKREELTGLIRAGRVEFTGGYNEPDEAGVGGEALIRNFVTGKLLKESMFGTKVRAAAQFDVFGHAVQLPQILLKSGHEFELHTRGNLTDLPSEFAWLAPDGYSIPTKRIEYGGTAGEVAVVPHQKKYFDLTDNAMIISGGDFTPPDRTIGSLLKNTKTFQILSAGPSEFFEALLKDADRDGVVIPQISRDNTPLLPGCYSSRIDTKLANRLAENTLTSAETFAALAALNGAQYPWAAFDKAWRQVLYTQHHDGLTGSDTENVNLDMLAGWREAVDIAAGVKRGAMAYLASLASANAFPGKKNFRPVTIFNSLNWERSEPVELTADWPDGVDSFSVFDSNKKHAPYQLVSVKKNAAGKTTWAKFVFTPEKVPSVGYAVYYIADNVKPAVSPVARKIKGNTARTGVYEITVDPARGGGIVSLLELATKKQYINSSIGVGNEFFSIKENAHKVEGPWSIHSTGQVWRSGDYPASVSIESGPVFTRITVSAEPVRASVKIYDGADKIVREEEEETLPRRVQEIIAYNRYPRIDFHTNILDYKETDFLFKTGFPADIKNGLPVFEERFSAVSRDKNDQEFLFYDFWREPGVKKGREYPAMNWVDLTAPPIFVFLDDDGNAKSSFPLAIGEIVSDFSAPSMKLSNKLAAAFIRKGVTTTPTSHDLRRTNEYYGFRVSLGVKGQNKYTEKILSKLGADAVKRLDSQIESGGFGFLFVNPADSVTATPDKKKIPVLIVVGGDEEALEGAVSQLTGDLEEHGNIILPYAADATGMDAQVEYAGLALINNGQPGNSVEYNGTLTLTLMRSSTSWPSGMLYSRNLETENWNHQYRYALLPHQGNWMRAKVWKYGHEFNNPLAALPEKAQHSGRLPASLSFLRTERTDAVISALKLKGYPYLDGKSPVDSGQLVLRLYNPTGFASDGTVKFYEPVVNVAEANLLEEPLKAVASHSNNFPIYNEAFSIDTYTFGAKDFSPPAKRKQIYSGNEEISLLNSRYWETNQGAAASGFQPVAITLEPGDMDVAAKRMELIVTVANNTRDRALKGVVTFNAPGDKVKQYEYNLEPGKSASAIRDLTNFDAASLPRQFVSAETPVDGQRYEDVLSFNEWKTLNGDAPGAEKPEFDDSDWRTVPLARFWSQGFKGGGVAWYRRWVFIPKGMGDRALHIVRLEGATVTVYLNGEEIRREKDGLSYSPLFAANIKYGEKNLFAFEVESREGEARMYADALAGSETLFSAPVAKFAAGAMSLKAGQSSKIKLVVTNPYNQKLEGAAQLVSPVETWPEGGQYKLISLAPAVKNFVLAPGESAALEFNASAPPDALPGPHWFMAKVIYAGKTSYTGVVDLRIVK